MGILCLCGCSYGKFCEQLLLEDCNCCRKLSATVVGDKIEAYLLSATVVGDKTEAYLLSATAVRDKTEA